MARIRQIDRADTLAQRAYASIREAIRDGTLTPDTVYSEAELAGSMGISRTPVREALIQLSREGLIEILRQRGFRLRKLTAPERTEVFGLRLALESFVIERLANEASADDIAELRELLEQQRSAIDNPPRFLEIDERFHLLMPRLLGLDRTHQMLLTLRGVMWLIGEIALTVRERAPHVLAEHTAIVDAIEAHDARRATKAIKDHLATTLEASEKVAELGPLP